MLILKTAWRSLRRSLLRSLCMVMAIAAMSGFLLTYVQNLDRTVQKLRNTAESINVYVEVKTLGGADDPYFAESLLQEMQKTGFVRDSALKTRVAFGYGSAVPDGRMQLTAMTAPELDRYFGKHLDSVVWAKDWTLETWIASDRPAVILPQSAGFSPGDAAALSLMPDDQTWNDAVLHPSVTVAGVFNDSLDDEDIFLHLSQESYGFCPLPWLAAQYGQGVWAGQELRYRYARILLQNTENINLFKARMVELGFNTETTNLRLIIGDRLLIGAANPLKKSVSLLRGVLPLLFALVTFLGALLCYLTMHSRRRELAVMRSLGMTSADAFFAFLLEAALLCVLDAAAGSLVLLRGGAGLVTAVGTLVLFSVFYLIGGSISIRLIDRPNVLELLKDSSCS